MSSSSILLSVCFLFVLSCHSILKTQVEAKSNVYIVYLGERQNKDPNIITESHHDMLANVVGSKGAAAELMVCSYRHGFSGFAAKVTESQAQKLAELPGVVRVIPNAFHKPQTTRSWDYLGLSPNSPSNLIHKSNKGDGVIIGIFDTGIWPESKSFNDEGLGPIPSQWKGSCKSGDRFNATIHCNKKIIGARWYADGLLAETGKPLNMSEDYLSPSDMDGHGTHVASTAAGSYVSNISYKGLAAGTLRGGAPGARLAVYKVCWIMGGQRCTSVDILKAFDEAIRDGVDVLSLSLKFAFPDFPEFDGHNPIAIGSFHAVARGITVVCSAGNMGPMAQAVGNTSPWILTVGASSVDRAFLTPITLANNKTILGQALFKGNKSGFTDLLYPVAKGNGPSVDGICDLLSLNPSQAAGKVVLCFMTTQTIVDKTSISAPVIAAGGVGLIIVKNPTDSLDACVDDFPCIEVDYEAGMQILTYIRSNRSPMVKLSHSRTYIGKPVSPKVAFFSSRGPNTIAPAILKPDIAAPGVDILAAYNPNDPSAYNGLAIISGTSMAAPHVSGIVALLKSVHPKWSPAAIKSALFTTASITDQYGYPIFAEGSPRKIADPFDFGGGIVNPNAATDPGLVYDMDTIDYIYYLCAMNYKTSAISLITEQPSMCPTPRPSVLNVNLPSVTIPNLKNTTTITRTVTNVGPVNSAYRAIIKPPKGTVVSVRPNVLVFNSTTKRISFTVTISSSHEMNGEYYFGSLTWTDGAHAVMSPISVRTVFRPFYAADFN